MVLIRIRRVLTCMVLLCVLTLSLRINAAASQSVPKVNAILSVDASNSMNYSDPGNISSEAIKLFIDMLSVQGDRVGIVSYTDQIERQKALTAIRGAGDKESLKEFASQLKRGMYTDITVGLSEAVRMLDDANDIGNKPMIILLTDGNNELDPNSGRTPADCEADTARIVAEARRKGYPIYTIGLNYNNKLNLGYIRAIADETKGLCFETSTADTLPDILSAIFAHQMEIRIKQAGEFIAGNDFQSIELDLSDPNIIEANIIILSGGDVEVELYDPSGAAVHMNEGPVVFTQSSVYSLVKIMQPQTGIWLLRVKGTGGDRVKVNLLYQYTVTVDMLVNAGAVTTAGDIVRVDVHLTGSSSADTSLYRESACTVAVFDTDTQTEAEYDAQYDGNVFGVGVVLPDAHVYELTAKVEHQNFFRVSDVFTISVNPAATTAAAPTSAASANNVPTKPPTNTPEANDVNSPDNFMPWIIGGLIVAAAAGLIAVILKKRNLGRVFTGKLIIEVTDNYNHERSAPQYRNLIEYGKRTDLLTLLKGAGSPKLASVALRPSPDAPSHMPQIIVTCADRQIVFKKDFMEQDASKGISMSLKSELTITLEAENKTIKVRYTS